MAAEALALALEEMREDGAPQPRPSSLDKVMGHPDFRDGVAFLVSADVPERTVRVNITMTARNLRAIDAKAPARGLTRSAFPVRSALAEQDAGQDARPRRRLGCEV